MKKILTLFAFAFLTTLSFAAYPVGSKENIDGSALGWSDSEKVWRPVAVDSTGAMQTSAGGTVIASISVDTSDISSSLIASTSQSASTAANILSGIKDSLATGGAVITSVDAVATAVNNKVIPLSFDASQSAQITTALTKTDTAAKESVQDTIASAAASIIGKMPSSSSSPWDEENVGQLLGAVGSKATDTHSIIDTVNAIDSKLKDSESVSVAENAKNIADQLDMTSSTVTGETLRKEIEDIRDALNTGNGEVCEQMFMSIGTPGVGNVVTINPLHARVQGRERKFIEIQAPTDDTVFYINTVSTGMTALNSRRCKGKVILRLSGYSESGTNKNTIYMIVPEAYSGNFIQTEGY